MSTSEDTVVLLDRRELRVLLDLSERLLLLLEVETREPVGAFEVGGFVGRDDGLDDGRAVGSSDGLDDGRDVGSSDGCDEVGVKVGEGVVGVRVGEGVVGLKVGDNVGHFAKPVSLEALTT